MKFSDRNFESSAPLDPVGQKLFDAAISLAKEIGDKFEALTKAAMAEARTGPGPDLRGLQHVQLSALSVVASQLIGTAPNEMRDVVLTAFLRDTETSARDMMKKVDELEQLNLEGGNGFLDKLKAALAKATAQGAEDRIKADRSTLHFVI